MANRDNDVTTTTTKEFAARAKKPEVDPADMLVWAAEYFGKGLLLATSLGPQSLVMLDLAHRHGLRFDVALIDTGLLFKETLRLADEVENRYGVVIQRARPKASVDEQALAEGPELWRSDSDRCCELRKVAPMAELLSGYRAWLTGLRRDQSPERRRTRPVAWDEQFVLVKVCPLVDWTSERVFAYLHENDVPYNPLLDEGYRSVGCTPCTSPTDASGDERSGRWTGESKTECGLHSRPVKLGRSGS